VTTYGHNALATAHYGMEEGPPERGAPWAQNYAGRAQGETPSSRSVADGDGLQLEVAAAE
jgi:hypothetical protein